MTSNRFEVDKDGGIINLQVKSNIDYNVTVAENSRTWIEPVISERTRGLSTSFILLQYPQVKNMINVKEKSLSLPANRMKQ